MDKLLEQVLKYVPADTIPLVLALVIAYFGTYYAKGFRNYSEALTSPTFLTAATILAAAFVVWQLQKSDLPKLPEGTKALLLVPRFQNDDGRQIETLFITQLRAALERSGKDPQVLQINAYVLD